MFIFLILYIILINLVSLKCLAFFELDKNYQITPAIEYIKNKYGSIEKWLGPGKWWHFQDSPFTSIKSSNSLKYSKHRVDQMKPNETIFIKKINSKNINTCYQLKTTDFKARTFCYPAIVITGYPKCGTSALYNLISRHPRIDSVSAWGKENCHRFVEAEESGTFSIWGYIKSLKKEFYTSNDKVLADGCIYSDFNLKISSLLHAPNTYYVVILRDYASLLWSAYNFWCKKGYDKNCAEGNWAIPGVHKRSPELFDKLVLWNLKPASPLLTKNPCKDAKKIFRSYLENFWKSIPRNMTVIVSNEQMETNPQLIWETIANKVGLDSFHPSIDKFKLFRINTQSHRGANICKNDINLVNLYIYLYILLFIS